MALIPRFKTKNAKTFNIAVKDDDGETVTDLATALDVIFVMKDKKTDTDVDSKLIKKLSEAELTIDDPAIGDIQIICTSSDLDILGKVFVACQINYPSDKNIEINISDNNTGKDINQIEFIEDVIRE